MPAAAHDTLTPLDLRALEIYESKLRAALELTHLGQAVAIHPDSGDYSIARTHGAAARELLRRHERDGRIVTLTIGPPTEADLRLAARMSPGRKS